MFTQTIKNWLHKLFAWWPWKQSSQIEFSQIVNSFNTGTTQETVSRSTIDGSVPQTGAAPRLSTIEEWPERVVQSNFPVGNEFTEAPPVSSTSQGEPAKESKTSTDGSSAIGYTPPSPQQRLEFLQYLIKRGVINEGFEEEM